MYLCETMNAGELLKHHQRLLIQERGVIAKHLSNTEYSIFTENFTILLIPGTKFHAVEDLRSYYCQYTPAIPHFTSHSGKLFVITLK